MTILDVNRLKQLVDVSEHKRDETILLAIESIENIYIKKYLGNKLFVYILENINASPTIPLVYTIVNGDVYLDNKSPQQKYFFNGLEKCIAQLSYCYLMMNQTTVTRYGAVNKNNPTSQRPDFTSVLEQVSRYRKVALSYLSDIDFFLRNCDTDLFSVEEQEVLTKYRATCVGDVDGILNEWI